MISIIKSKYLLSIFVLSFLFLSTFLSIGLGANKVLAAPACDGGSWSPSSVVWKNIASPVKTQNFTLNWWYKTGWSTPGYTTTNGTDSCTAPGLNGTNTCPASRTTANSGPEDPSLGYPCEVDSTIDVTSPVNRVDLDYPVCGTWNSTNAPTYTLSGSTDATSGISTAGGTCTASPGVPCTVPISDIAGNPNTCTSPTPPSTKYNVTASAGPGGDVNPKFFSADYGSTVSFTATPGASSDDWSNCSRICPRWCLYNQNPNDNNSWTLRKNGYCTQDEVTEVYTCHDLDENQNIS